MKIGFLQYLLNMNREKGEVGIITTITTTWSKIVERKVVDIPPHDVIAQKYLSFLDSENVIAS